RRKAMKSAVLVDVRHPERGFLLSHEAQQAGPSRSPLELRRLLGWNADKYPRVERVIFVASESERRVLCVDYKLRFQGDGLQHRLKTGLRRAGHRFGHRVGSSLNFATGRDVANEPMPSSIGQDFRIHLDWQPASVGQKERPFVDQGATPKQ